MENCQVLRNNNAKPKENKDSIVDQKSLPKGTENAPFCTSRSNTVLMSPTDTFFSPCTRKLASRKGRHYPSLMSMTQRQLGKVLQNEGSQQETKENN